MKRYLLLLLLIQAVACSHPKAKMAMRIDHFMSCGPDRTVIITMKPGDDKGEITCTLYPDANRNKILDESDEMVGMELKIALSKAGIVQTEPTQVDSNWAQKDIFIVAISGQDTTISSIPPCSASKVLESIDL